MRNDPQKSWMSNSHFSHIFVFLCFPWFISLLFSIVAICLTYVEEVWHLPDLHTLPTPRVRPSLVFFFPSFLVNSQLFWKHENSLKLEIKGPLVWQHDKHWINLQLVAEICRTQMKTFTFQGSFTAVGGQTAVTNTSFYSEPLCPLNEYARRPSWCPFILSAVLRGGLALNSWGPERGSPFLFTSAKSRGTLRTWSHFLCHRSGDERVGSQTKRVCPSLNTDLHCGTEPRVRTRSGSRDSLSAAGETVDAAYVLVFSLLAAERLVAPLYLICFLMDSRLETDLRPSVRQQQPLASRS